MGIISERLKGLRTRCFPFFSRRTDLDVIRTSFFEEPCKRPNIIAVANQKGGCGKTTTAVNLSGCLAQKGHKVLLVDLDSQGNASLGLGIDIETVDRSIYDCITRGEELAAVVRPTVVTGLDVAPADELLSGVTLEIANHLGRENVLKATVEQMISSGREYDYVIIDCAPTLSLLTINALVAAEFVLIPIQVHFYSLQGMKGLLSTIDIVKERLNKELKILGVLPTLFDPYVKTNYEILGQIRDHFKDMLFDSVIHNGHEMAEATMYSKPIHLHDPASRGAKEHLILADEVVSRIESFESARTGLKELIRG